MATVGPATLVTNNLGGVNRVQIPFTLATGESITRITRISSEDGNHSPDLLNNEFYAISEDLLPITASGQYHDTNYAWGANQYRFTVSNGTTETVMTVGITVEFDTVHVATQFKNGGRLDASELLGQDFEGLLTYQRQGQLQNLVHNIPGRTLVPLVKYRSGQLIRSNLTLMYTSKATANTEYRTEGIEAVLRAAGQLIIRRPNIRADGITYSIPDIRGALESYTIRHDTVKSEDQQIFTTWFVDLVMTEAKES